VKDFAGKVAVITGGGSGMGRELAVQLAEAGCHVAMCDLNQESMAEAKAAALATAASSDVRITTHQCDVGDEASILVFRDQVVEAFGDHINLLFNNAGISGGGSMITSSREDWERCFDICWGGVYHGTRAFLDLVIASDEGHIVNTSSVNGFWASLGPERPHSAYSAAKFAVKGFTEALVNDLRLNAPHVKCSVVMPGHIGTNIVSNSMAYGVDGPSEEMAPIIYEAAAAFRDLAPMTASEAARVILDGVRDERWRILVGEDAHALDAAVRANPELAYEGDAFVQVMANASSTAPAPTSGQTASDS